MLLISFIVKMVQFHDKLVPKILQKKNTKKLKFTKKENDP